jgi:hypothetical protein
MSESVRWVVTVAGLVGLNRWQIVVFIICWPLGAGSLGFADHSRRATQISVSFNGKFNIIQHTSNIIPLVPGRTDEKQIFEICPSANFLFQDGIALFGSWDVVGFLGLGLSFGATIPGKRDRQTSPGGE